MLTHSCPEITMPRAVCIYDNFENNVGIECKFGKYLKESCLLGSNQHIFFNFLFAKCFGHKDNKTGRVSFQSTNMLTKKHLDHT